MSAESFTDCSISCDHPGCHARHFASNITTALDLTAAELRKELKRRGWTVSIKNPEGRQRKDFCPLHTPGSADAA